MKRIQSKYLLVIGGPTASGKTALAIQLARHFQTEIVSADSRQFYRQMSIGTAKPSAEELAAAPHHLIDNLDITQPYSVGDFEKDALRVLDKIYQKNDVAILIGGSGLYLQAVCEGLNDFPNISENTRKRVEELEHEGGLQLLQTELGRLDPVQFSKIDQQNPARLRRALEVCLESGLPYSTFLEKPKPERFFQPIYILLDVPRPKLYARIDERVDQMIADGLEQEALSLLPYREKSALRTVGYEEWFEHFDGLRNRKETIEKIKQHSRNYAKRQDTWFRKYGNWKPFAPEDLEGMLRHVRTILDFSE